MTIKKLLLPILLVIAILSAFFYWKGMPKEKQVLVSEPEPVFEKHGELYFIKNNKDTVSQIAIEIVDDRDAIMQGLMYRKSMADSLGMLFVFPNEQERSFWMKNTYVPLDIIYVDEDLEIVSISENNPPLSERSIPSNGRAKYVVEVIGGYAVKRQIQPGDKVAFIRE